MLCCPMENILWILFANVIFAQAWTLEQAILAQDFELDRTPRLQSKQQSIF